MQMPNYLLGMLRGGVLKHALRFLAVIAVLSPTSLIAQKLPTPKHIVIVIEENHSFSQIIGNKKDAPYLNELAERGASFNSFFALHHPSQPNYLVLFSGDRQGVKNNDCPKKLTVPSLGGELLRVKGKDGFRGYAEDLPSADPAACGPKPYARKHVPWTNFADVPPYATLPFTAFKDFDNLPFVSIVVPNLNNDMHDGKDKIRTADTWLKQNLASYIEWAQNNDSLLIITWDEGNSTSFLWFNRTTKPPSNRIPTIFIGPMVKAGGIATQYTHLDLLRTLEEMYGVSPFLGASRDAKPITDCWK